MSAKAVCPTHEIAYLVGGACPYCEPPEPPSREDEPTTPFKTDPEGWYLNWVWRKK